MIPKTLTVRQAMEQTGFTRSHVYRLVHRGEWQAIKGSDQRSSIRILESSIEAWFAEQLKGQAGPTPKALDADRELPPVSRRAFA